MARIIYADGRVQEVSPKNGTDFSLKELQDIVGGYIEIARTIGGEVMVINEEGKMLGLAVNKTASGIYAFADTIVGDVLVCNENEVK